MKPTPKAPSSSSSDASGAVLADRYELAAPIGQGSFSNVYRALDRATGQSVAVKILQAGPWQGTDQEAARIESFRSEMRLGASVPHRGIARLRDAGATTDGLPFGVYDLVEGPSLRERLQDGAVFDPGVSIRLLAEVLEALAAAHSRGVVHCDLKPENILIAREGPVEHAVLVDFGLGASARTTGARESRAMIGTPLYAAPEQLRGATPTPRSDLYSWGLIAIECLTGAAAVHAEAAHEAVRAQLDDAAIAIPPVLEPLPIASLLRRVTAKDPALRPENAGEALRELSQLVGTLTAGPQPAGSGEKVRRSVTIVSVRFADLPDPADAAASTALEQAFQSCAGHFAKSGATILSALADRVVAGFGLRHDDPRHAERAVAASVDWLEAHDSENVRHRRRCSIGIHSGAAELDLTPAPPLPPRGLSGALTTTALALDAAARPGRVLLSDSTRMLVAGEWTFVSAGQVSAAPAFQIRRRRTRASDRSAPLSLFAGRHAETTLLEQAWADAQSGRPSAALVSGEAGIGKSRIVREFRNHLPGGDWIEARCTPEHQARPYGALAQLFAALGASSTRLAARHDLDPAESVPILATLLGETLPAGYTMPVATPDRLKELTQSVAMRVLLAMCEDEPLVVVVEDLQWADVASLELISRLLEQGWSSPGARMLLLMTARPDFTSPWREDVVVPVRLGQLEPADVEALIAARAGGAGNVAADVLGRAVAACRGVPLFAEEAAFLLGAKTGSGDAEAMPGSVDALLQARMKSLSPRALELAGTAAAVGQEFRIDVVEAAAGRAGAALRELTDAGLVVAADKPQTYAFRHALLRDAVYETLGEKARAPLHLRIAKVVQEKFPALAAERPADLALHFEKGGDAMAAGQLWHQAGSAAMASASYLEAQKLFDRGLRTLEAAPPTLTRAQRELGLTTGLATAHLSVEGYGAAVTREKFAKARLLCTELGLEAPLEVLGGIFGATLVTSDNEGIESILPVFQILADRTDSPAHAVAGHQMLGVHGFWSGRYSQGRRHSSLAMELYRRPWVRDTSWEYGFGLYCYAYGMVSEYQLGYPDRAEAILEEMLSLAGESRNAYTLSLALGFATTLTKDCGRPARTMELATRLIAMSVEQHLYIWYALGLLAQGSALLQLGQPQEALGQMRTGLSMLDTFGFYCSYSSYLTYLTEALLACGELDEALETADKGLAIYKAHWTRFNEPDMTRLRGEVLEAKGDGEGAEREYRHAIGIARADEGLTFELRAATALAHLLARRGDRAGALGELEPVYSRFTEGFSTQDLLRAGRLRTELRQAG